MGSKFTKTDIVKYCKNIGIEFLDYEYKNISHKHLFKCYECGEPYEATFAKVRHRNKIRCNDCSSKHSSDKRKHSIDWVRGYCKSVGSAFISPKYTTSLDTYKFRCSCCGETYSATFAKFQHNNKIQCNKCSGREKMTTERAIEYCGSVGVEFLSDKYKGDSEMHKFKCSCGEVFHRSWNVFKIRKTHTCDICSNRIKWNKVKMDKWVSDNRSDYLLISDKFESILSLYEFEYIGKLLKPECDSRFKTSWASFKSFKSSHPNLTMSSGESIIYNLLKDCCIEFQKEKTFDGLKGYRGGSLRFDFYIESLNLIIEFDGEQHYYPTNNFGKVDAMKNYMITRNHDLKKNKYCRDNGIKLLRIPYYEKHQINKILKYALGL